MGQKELLLTMSEARELERCDCSDIFGNPDHVFYLRYLPLDLFERYQHAALKLVEKNDPRGLQTMLLAMALCDEDGEVVFDYKKQTDLEIVARIKAKVTSRLYKKANEMNIITEANVKEEAEN